MMNQPFAQVGGCCVCSDEQGWNENPLVYCDGQGCSVAVHQACYGIVTVPTGPWYCRKCESQERQARVRCELCPSKDGALKRTDNGGWAHVVCALYIPEVRFGNVATMEPIILALVPQERYNKVCYLCLENSGKESKASHGACMQCNKAGCKEAFHVTCAQAHGLLCEEAGNYMDNVKYCGYCDHHFSRINKKLVKTIPAFRPVPNDDLSPVPSPDKGSLGLKEAAKHLQAASSGKGKGKRGRKPGSMIYEPKLEPPKFNPDLASLSSSNNFINNVGNSNSVTLTPVSNFSSDHKAGNFSSEARNSNSNSNSASKTPNVVVKLGKHGEVYHAKKDSPSQSNGSSSEQREEGILERVSPAVEVKEECGSEKKSSGFTTANFTESFVTASVSVTAALIKSDTEPSGQTPDNRSSPATRVKVEASEPAQDSEAPTSSLSSTSSSSSIPHSQASTASSPSPSAPLPTTTSSGLVFTLEPQKAPTPPASSKATVGLSKATVGPVSKPAMFPNRHSGPGSQQASPGSRHGLGSSVSLFPTSAGSHLPKSNDSHPPPSHHLSQPSNSSAPSASSHPSGSSHSNSTHPPSLHSSVSIMPSSVTSPSSTLTVSRMAPTSSQPVTISPVSLDAEPRLSHGSPTPNNAKASPSPSALLSPRSKQQAAPASATGNGPVKRIGRPPKKGTHMTTSSLQGAVQTIDSEEEEVASSSKRARTDSGEKKLGEETKKEGATTDNGMTARFMMFGATLNPTSGQAKDLNTVLQSEVANHQSAYTSELVPQLTGVPLPGRRRAPEAVGRLERQAHTVAGMLDPSRQPQTLEELLERHWEQGSRFLMEQASHFDIASLLSSLHQLREENLGLEDSVDRLIARRDHLLAVRARLLALNSLTLGSMAQESRSRDPPPSAAGSQNGPTASDRRLVSPISRPEKAPPLPSPRDRGPPPAASPHGRGGPPPPSSRDQSPRLLAQHHGPPSHHLLENGDQYGRHERLGGAQLLTVAQGHGGHPGGSGQQPPHPPKAHYPPHSASLQHPRGAPHDPRAPHYSTPNSYQMVSPPAPKGSQPPMPAHSGAHLMPGHRSTPPGHVSNAHGHHGHPPMQPHMMQRGGPSSVGLHKK